KLYRQHGIHRDPSHELRSVCFTALQMALDTKRPKFVTMGLNGLHVLNSTIVIQDILRLSFFLNCKLNTQLLKRHG
ncbi:hypothetical protein DOY81_013065, partial [Sarcophaga bullata]